MRRCTLAAPLLAVLLGVAACGDDAAAPEDVEPADDVTDEEVATTALGLGLVADLPASWEVDELEPATPQPGCTAANGSIRAGQERLALIMPSTACSTGSPQDAPLNGDHGRYLSIADVHDPLEAEQRDVDAGQLELFEQEYEECTQECVVYMDRVALVRLDDPPDPDRPTLMIVAGAERVGVEELAAWAATVRPG